MINKITALFTALLLTVTLNTATVFAQVDIPSAPTPPPAPETPQQPAVPTPPSVPNATEAPQSTPTPTTAPSETAQPKAEKTPHPKAATPKPASTPKNAQAAQTPQPAQTAIPAVSENSGDEGATSTAAPAMTPQYAQSTGGQHESGQQGSTLIQTGDANVGVNANNQVNQNLVQSGASPTGSNGGSSTNNNGNGSDSHNNASSNSTNSSDVQLGNIADLNNDIAVGAYTGGNSASRNIGDNAILTGDANVGVTVINGGNNNVEGLVVNQYDVNNNQSGDVILGQSPTTASCGVSSVCTSGVLGSAQNTGNGTDSTSNASSNSTNNSNTEMTNQAEVVNNVAVDAVTGKNKADSNVGNANIETGDVNVAVTILNFLNNNILAGVVDVVNIFDNFSGDIVLPEDQQPSTVAGNNAAGNHVSNKQNGSESTNDASQSNSLTKDVGQTNVADIDNNININANTGDNRAASNTQGDNNVDTGDVQAHAQVYNMANINSNEGGYVVLVNDKGTWRGKIIGAEGSENIDFVIQPDGTVVATNQANGADSTNNAQSNQTSTETVQQTNTASLQNNVNINADTGNNSASRNTGGDSQVSTGDVNVGASIMNFVNNNFVGKTFRVLLVNVFGDWGGSVRKSGEASSSNQTPAIGGASAQNTSNTDSLSDNSSEVSTDSQTNSASPVARASAASSEASAITSTARAPRVLGSMTNNNSGAAGFSLVLEDGRTFFTDDTIQTTSQPPLVASDVHSNSTSPSALWLLLVLPIVAAATFGFRKMRGLIA